MAKTKKPGAHFVAGMVTDAKGKTLLTLEEAQIASSKCGCGPDCCNNVYHWRDLTTNEHYVTYINNGVSRVQLYSDFVANGPL